MDRKEIVNSQDYKAQGIALDWWRHNGYDIKDGVVDIIDAYTEGVIYGWNNPQWIPVDKELPKENGKTGQSISVWATNGLITCEMRYNFDTKTWTDMWGDPFDITHWMSLPQPPRKEE